jgi:hypothetical protein
LTSWENVNSTRTCSIDLIMPINVTLFSRLQYQDKCIACFSLTFLRGVIQDFGPGWLSRYSDSLRAGRSGYRIPLVARFSAPVQTWPWGPASLLYSGYRVTFPGAKRLGRGVKHPLPSNAEVKERIKLTSTPRLSLHGLFQGRWRCNAESHPRRAETFHVYLSYIVESFCLYIYIYVCVCVCVCVFVCVCVYIYTYTHTVIPRLTKIIRSGIAFVNRNLR